MICYASSTGTKRNLAVLRWAQWRLFISRTGHWDTYGFPYAIDNGAWVDFKTGSPFDGDRFSRMLDRMGAAADFIVLPDIVGAGLRSLELTLAWIDRVRAYGRRMLIAVQDGIGPSHVRHLVGPNVGIFLGGSTGWKLSTMPSWGAFCLELGIYYHVARVNSAKRTYCAIAAGADSIDGSSVSRFAKTLPMLDAARKQTDFWGPK